MNTYQSIGFLLIVALVTARTLVFRSVAAKISPSLTAWAIGSGTFAITLTCLPVAWQANLSDSGRLLAWQGIVAGVGKGVLLTILLYAQQKLIVRSLSATTYVFPVALGLIGILDIAAFGAAVTPGGLFSIAVLSIAGVAFFGLGQMQILERKHKRLFVLMVAAAVSFACCDRFGIPASGWYTYLLYTGLGNMISAALMCRHIPKMQWLPWMAIALCWSLPELYFNFAISESLPVSYGYLAISLRVPIIMLIALLFFKEGKPTSQIAFGLISLAGALPAFF